LRRVFYHQRQPLQYSVHLLNPKPRRTTLSWNFSSKHLVTMSQLERLYRYNEEVDSSFSEPAIASSHSNWRDACADDLRVAPASEDKLHSTQLEQLQLQSQFQTPQNVFSSHWSAVCQKDVVMPVTSEGFLSPRSPATLSSCSTPRTLY
jgi:hypothetical protein